jgi:Tol biopolymer transport system component
MNREGGERRPLLEGARVMAHVAWSPDGARLAFEQTTLTETSDIWVMNASGSGATNLTPDPFPGVWFDRHPAWSPDGTRIAFSSTRSGPSRLWTTRATGGDFVQVLPSVRERPLERHAVAVPLGVGDRPVDVEHTRAVPPRPPPRRRPTDRRGGR